VLADEGSWFNRAPTGYDMINGKLEANEMAPLVQRIFTLRAAGLTYPPSRLNSALSTRRCATFVGIVPTSVK